MSVVPTGGPRPGAPLRVGVIGAGYWGPNVVRNLATCPRTRVTAVCDIDPARLAAVHATQPAAFATTSVRELVARADVDAVAVATPASTHAEIATAALDAGKHVLVEKPLATTVAAGEALVERARACGRTLMVDHTYVYTRAVEKIKALVDAGELGELYYVDGVRINLGLFQHDVNVVWDLAPHDLSILDHLVGRLPLGVSAFGSCHADRARGVEDVAHLNIDYGGGLMASLHVNWLSPVKIRHFIIGGSRKSIVYNDLDPAERVKVYDRGVTIDADPEQRRLGMLVGYRTGDVWTPHLESVEPLLSMVEHFAACVLDGTPPRTDGAAGLRVLRILAAAQASLAAQGRRIAP